MAPNVAATLFVSRWTVHGRGERPPGRSKDGFAESAALVTTSCCAVGDASNANPDTPAEGSKFSNREIVCAS